jgi:hypothetical protein
MKLKFIAALAGTVLMAGCSSIISQSEYSVAIDSSPTGASFIITNKAGQRVHSGVTPSSVTLNSSAGYFKGEAYTIALTKNGYLDKTYTIQSSIDGWYWGNILLGGLIGMLIVDPATGAMYNLPDRVDISLEQTATSASLLQIKTIDMLTADDKARLVKLN